MMKQIWQLRQGNDPYISIRGGLRNAEISFRKELNESGYYYFVCALPRPMNLDGSLTFEKLKLQNVFKRLDANTVSVFSVDIQVTVNSKYQKIMSHKTTIDLVEGKESVTMCFEIQSGFVPASIEVKLEGHSLLKKIMVVGDLVLYGSEAPSTLTELNASKRIERFLSEQAWNRGRQDYAAWLELEREQLAIDIDEPELFGTSTGLSHGRSRGASRSMRKKVTLGFTRDDGPLLVYDLQSTSEIGEAMFLLMDNQILSAPVWDETAKAYLGFFDIQDGVSLSLKLRTEIESQNRPRSESVEINGVVVDDISSVKKTYGMSLPLSKFFEGGNHSLTPWNPVSPDTNMDDVMALVGNKDTHWYQGAVHKVLDKLQGGNFSHRSCPRVPVIDGSGKVVKIISQSGILYQIFRRYLRQGTDEWVDDFFQSNELVSSCIKRIQSVHITDPIQSAFKKILNYDTHYVAVLDDDGAVVGSLSAIDVWLFSKIELDEAVIVDMTRMTVQHFLQVAEVAAEEHFSKTRPKCVTFTKQATLSEVITQLVRNHVHDAFIVDEKRHPIGIVEIYDVLHAIIEREIPLFRPDETVEDMFLYDYEKRERSVSEVVRLSDSSARSPRNGGNKSVRLPKDISKFCPVGRDGFCSVENQYMLSMHLPISLRRATWERVFNIIQDGSSVITLKELLADIESPMVVAVRDTTGIIFGGFLPTGLYIEPEYRHTRHLGYSEESADGESFVYSFSKDGATLTVYPWAGTNRYFRIINEQGFGMGGGGDGFAFFVDEFLNDGSSDKSETYTNECLAGHSIFQVSHFEIFKLT